MVIAISRNLTSASAIVYSDATATGHGGYSVQIGKEYVVSSRKLFEFNK